jgi:class 3 adenylate cyclase
MRRGWQSEGFFFGFQRHKRLADLLEMKMRSPEKKEYARPDAAALCARFRKSMDELVHQHPELILVKDEFDEVVRHDADPLRELAGLLEACQEVFLELRHLLNPIGLPVRLTEDGRILTHTFQDVAAFVTDIRGFTEMTQNVEERWGVNVFDVLSCCYFPHVVDVLERYDCHYLNYTGDGLLVLSLGRRDEAGQVLLPGLDNAVLCALEMTAVTNSIAEAWKRLGLTQANGTWHETGLGLSSGSVQVGDPFVPDQTAVGKLAQFDELFRTLVAQSASFYQPRDEYKRRVVGIHALSPVINRASRLQDVDKLAPQHTCMMTATDVERLSPPLRQWFERVGKMYLKGIGEMDVFGFHRFGSADVPALEKECRDHYAAGRS